MACHHGCWQRRTRSYLLAGLGCAAPAGVGLQHYGQLGGTALGGAYGVFDLAVVAAHVLSGHTCYGKGGGFGSS